MKGRPTLLIWLLKIIQVNFFQVSPNRLIGNLKSTLNTFPHQLQDLLLLVPPQLSLPMPTGLYDLVQLLS